MSVIYAVMAAVALLLLAVYCVLVRQKEFWLLMMFVYVAIVNTGYFLLSVSQTLSFALLANDVVYFGSVFLSMCMLLTIMKLCGFKVGKKLVVGLLASAILMFCIIATSGFLPWYYREVSLVRVDGGAKLEKEYGVLHPLYLIYLLGYFAAMIVCIIRSSRKKTPGAQKQAALVAAIVFGNIAVWLVEKFISWEFEFLSVSYLFSELVFLGLYWMMDDYVCQNELPKAVEPPAETVDVASLPPEEKIRRVMSHLGEGVLLATREREILSLMLENKKRKEIADALCLSENTIKTYTRTLYSKLGINSREELYAMLVK
ncbi:MAG: hypothetical protein IJW99_11015 [Clostridia bacterium]|nr:hypothetical protein [Clostridia bacterium]